MLRLLLFVALLSSSPAVAQPASDPVSTSIAALDQASKDYQSIDQALNGQIDPSTAGNLDDRANALRKSISDQVDQLSAQLALIDARVVQLGPVTPGVTETADVATQRKLLGTQRSAVDSAVKRGKLLGVETDQLIAEVDADRANAFSERMSHRVASPLTPTFWSEVLHAAPRDFKRLSLFIRLQAGAIRQGAHGVGIWSGALGLLVAIGLMIPLRMALRRLGRHVMIQYAPGSRLRRSGFALWITVSGTLIPGFSALAIVDGFHGSSMLAPSWESFADSMVRASFITGLIGALGGALLQRRQPSWRLVNLSDEAASALRPWTWATAAVTFVSILLDAFSIAVGLSGPAREASNGFSALLHILLAGGILVMIGERRTKRAASLSEGDPELPGATGLAAVSLLIWAALIISLFALAMGYLSAALLISREVLWLPVIFATFYLLLISTDDICTGLIAQDSRLGRVLHSGFGVRVSLIDQAGVALSALLRIGLLLLGLSFAFAPFGSDVGSLFEAIGQLAAGVTIGQVTISPGAIFRAVAVLMVGIFLVRTVQRWLVERYLPTTEFDAGARNSIAMVARYTGLILAGLWALTSLGIGIQRIALLLSALSVGIGFGLQAITQNFVSGLILLAERPVKIGDWVRIGDQEGDVKRISVRSTEIGIADRSTLIVPNSELITKSILNKTLSDPIGRVQLQFSVPLGTNVSQVRDMVLAMFADTAAVLEEPSPVFFIDSIADGRVNFNSFAYVRSPRDVYPTKSLILFRLLEELPQKDIELGTTPQMVQWVGHPGASPRFDAAPPGSSGILDTDV